jgi:hypothetical protein
MADSGCFILLSALNFKNIKLLKFNPPQVRLGVQVFMHVGLACNPNITLAHRQTA